MEGIRPPTGDSQHVALEITPPWLESIKCRAGMSLSRKPPAKPTIFRVPPNMRCVHQGTYEPKLVSIGPYHRGKSEDLKAMEELKWRLLHNYLSRVPNGSKNEGLRKMKDLEKPARDCYSEVIVDLDSDQFVEMLLLDGCFLLQIFTAAGDKELGEEELTSLLFYNVWFEGLIFRDMLLLENQLPYFVVEHLLDTLEMPGWNSSHLQRVAISSFVGLLPQYSKVPKPELRGQVLRVDHLLGLLHKWILSVPKLEKASNTRSCCCKLFLNLPSCSVSSLMINAIGNCLSKPLRWRSNYSSLSERFPWTVPTTTELAEAGVKIEKREAYSFLAVSFCKNRGVLKIPAIIVDDGTDFFLANLIALEQCCPEHGMDITHYTLFLDDIINTPRDVELLHRKGIIHRCLGADEDIASLFNKLGNGVTFSPSNSYLNDVYKDLNVYCQSSWHRWRAKAAHDYFNNPWAIISLGAALLLLGLAILQSVYAILDYYKE